MKFELGEVVTTPGALFHLTWFRASELVARHASGDWGDLEPADVDANERALKDGSGS